MGGLRRWLVTPARSGCVSRHANRHADESSAGGFDGSTFGGDRGHHRRTGPRNVSTWVVLVPGFGASNATAPIGTKAHGSGHGGRQPEYVADNRHYDHEGDAPGSIPPTGIPIFDIEHCQHHRFNDAHRARLTETWRIEHPVVATMRTPFVVGSDQDATHQDTDVHRLSVVNPQSPK